MSKLWLFHSPKGTFGPFTSVQLNRFRENGLLLPSSVLQNSKTGETIQAANLPELFASTETISSDVQNLSCKVRFDSFSSGRDPAFKGKGTVATKDNCLTITGRPNRLFAFRRREEKIPLNRILNVTTEGKILRFRVESDKKNSPSRILRFVNREEAADFAKRLPTRLSPEVAQAKADAEVYAKFLLNNGRPYVTYALVGLNLFIFILCVMAGIDWLTGKTNLWIEFGGNFALSTATGQWWRLFTAMFLHAGIAHVLLNMWALWEAGKVAERIFGHKQYALLYLMSGIMGGMASINWQQEVVSVGASGAVFGIYGALVAALMLRKDLLPGSITVQMRNSALVFITYALFNGFTKSGIDNAAHLGGLIAGAVIGAGYVIQVRRA
ncbi:MAG: rhomboid family intramembrane serine protease [Gallionella sp.]|jgi:membrane associated rhomboid family serine protease|nr:rhomboid family intramembrane serine protease [Gallionella sp.]MCK9354340.1 rhomboid family intramembrane serine protease [Gallionella sp.]